MYNEDDNYEENGYVSKRVVGILLGLLGGLIGLLIGLLLYPAETFERETFISGWKRGFIIAIALVFCYVAFVVVSLLFLV